MRFFNRFLKNYTSHCGKQNNATVSALFPRELYFLISVTCEYVNTLLYMEKEALQMRLN